MALFLALQPKLLTVLPGLDLRFEAPSQFEQDCFQSVIAGRRVNIWAGHG